MIIYISGVGVRLVRAINSVFKKIVRILTLFCSRDYYHRDALSLRVETGRSPVSPR